MNQRLATEAAFHEYVEGARGTHVRARADSGPVYRLLALQERDFLRSMGSLEGVRVLSYGCGTGYVTPLARLGARVTGLDISESAIRLLETAIRDEGLADLADARVGDCEATPFPDWTFDLVVGSGILHHLNTRSAAKEIRRILRPGGRAIFREPLATNPVLALYRHLTPGRRTPTEHPFLPSDFRALEEHFTEVRWQAYGLFSLAAAPLARFPRAMKLVLPPLTALDHLVTRTLPPR